MNQQKKLHSVKRLAALFLLSLCGCSAVTTKHERLPAQAGDVASSVIGNLFWGRNPDDHAQWSAASLKNFIQTHPSSEIARSSQVLLIQAQRDLGNTIFTPLTKLYFRGIVPTDPKHIQSVNAVNQFPHLFAFAVCARIASGEIAESCLRSVKQGILGSGANPGWVRVYQSSGDPIDEIRLIELFLAIDWAMPLMAANEKAQVQNWLLQFQTNGDLFYLHSTASDPNLKANNSNTLRMAIRSLVMRIAHGHMEDLQNAPLVHEQVLSNLLPPAGWRPNPNCTNDIGIKDYMSLDFRERDALTYHVFDLDAFSKIALYAPQAVSPSDHQIIADAWNLVEPFYLGSKIHVEFVCSTTPYDAKECALGSASYCQIPWAPQNSKISPVRSYLIEDRAAFPEIKNWSSNVWAGPVGPALSFRAAVLTGI